MKTMPITEESISAIEEQFDLAQQNEPEKSDTTNLVSKPKKKKLTVDEEIALLEQKLEQKIKLKKQMERKKKALENKQHRADDTRRKILAGACILEQASKDENINTYLLSSLNNFLTHDRDRALFKLKNFKTNN